MTSDRNLVLPLSAVGLLRLQLAVIAGLLAASTLGQFLFRLTGDVPVLDALFFLFYLDGEMTLPALYSGAVLAVCAVGFAWIGRLERDGSRALARFWRTMSLVLAWMAFDEVFAVHEQAIEPFRALFGITDGPLYYAWVVPAIAAVALVGLFVSGGLRRLPPDTRWRFVASGAVYVAGAVGVEMITATTVTDSGAFDPDAYDRPGVLALVTLEEGLELLGVALLLAAQVRHVERRHAPVGIELAVAPPRSARP